MSTAPRFFVPQEAIVGDFAHLPPESLHHARTVLRMRAGESLVLHDGAGFAYEATLGEGGSATVAITRRYALNTEPAVRIVIAQALPKTTDKAEEVLQHGTEVGASGFILFASQRSVARLESREKVTRRQERWSEIIKSAAEQSRRGLLPSVAWEPNLSGLIARLTAFECPLVLHESASPPLRSVLGTPATGYLLIVGPEGGFTDEEVSSLTGAGATAVQLGPRILRTETAALVGLSQILYAHESSLYVR